MSLKVGKCVLKFQINLLKFFMMKMFFSKPVSVNNRLGIVGMLNSYVRIPFV
jgi:hypothetical protein